MPLGVYLTVNIAKQSGQTPIGIVWCIVSAYFAALDRGLHLCKECNNKIKFRRVSKHCLITLFLIAVLFVQAMSGTAHQEDGKDTTMAVEGEIPDPKFQVIRKTPDTAALEDPTPRKT